MNIKNLPIMSNITTSTISRKMAKSSSQPILLSNKQIMPESTKNIHTENYFNREDLVSRNQSIIPDGSRADEISLVNNGEWSKDNLLNDLKLGKHKKTISAMPLQTSRVYYSTNQTLESSYGASMLNLTGRNQNEYDKIPKLSKKDGLPILGNKEFSIMKSIKKLNRDNYPSALLPYLSNKSQKNISQGMHSTFKDGLGTKLPSTIKYSRFTEK
mmetsp:Transcript_16795/g.14732  ORF Transcript_16795/g.14732 Transcript_16795/m.14732 type:complete len:214 (-) Transcript_16795:83-724(-)